MRNAGDGVGKSNYIKQTHCQTENEVPLNPHCAQAKPLHSITSLAQILLMATQICPKYKKDHLQGVSTIMNQD